MLKYSLFAKAKEILERGGFMQKTEKYFDQNLPVFDSVERLEDYLYKNNRTITIILGIFSIIITILFQALIMMIYGWTGFVEILVVAIMQFFGLMFCMSNEIKMVAPTIDETTAIILTRDIKNNYQRFIIYPVGDLPAIAILDAEIDEFQYFKKASDIQNPEMEGDIVSSSYAPKGSIQYLLDQAGLKRAEEIRIMSKKIERAFLYSMLILVTFGTLNFVIIIGAIIACCIVSIMMYRIDKYKNLHEEWSLSKDFQIIPTDDGRVNLYGSVHRVYWDISMFSKTKKFAYIPFRETAKVEDGVFVIKIMGEEHKIPFK